MGGDKTVWFSIQPSLFIYSFMHLCGLFIYLFIQVCGSNYLFNRPTIVSPPFFPPIPSPTSLIAPHLLLCCVYSEGVWLQTLSGIEQGSVPCLNTAILSIFYVNTPLKNNLKISASLFLKIRV